MVSKIQNEKILEETKLLVNLFLDTNESDIELSKRTGISSSTVGRRLTNKKNILATFSQNGEELFNKIASIRKNNSYSGKVLGGQISLLNGRERNAETNGKLRLEIFSKSKEKQLQLLVHLALTYRLSLTLLSELFQIEENELLEKMLSVCNESSSKAIQFLFNKDKYQSKSKEKVLDFCESLVNVRKNKDKEGEKLIFSQIDDSKIINLIKEIESGKELNDDDYMIILNYQLKYALSIPVTIATTKVKKNKYLKKIKELLIKDKNIYNRFEQIIKYIK